MLLARFILVCPLNVYLIILYHKRIFIINHDTKFYILKDVQRIDYHTKYTLITLTPAKAGGQHTCPRPIPGRSLK